jgi:hypothetical protein
MPTALSPVREQSKTQMLAYQGSYFLQKKEEFDLK